MPRQPGSKKKHQTAAPGRGMHEQRAPDYAWQFLEMIRDLPQVKQVTFEAAVPEICTVIDAPWPDFEYSDPIYRAEGDLLRAHPDLRVDLRVVNRTRNHIRDYGEQPPEGIIYLLRR